MFLRHRISISFALLVLFAGKSAFASQRWVSVTTSHFEMYTTNSEKQAIRALQVFEQVRYFFLQNSKNKQVPEGRVRIIAFSSEKDYKPYRLNSGAFAYYLPSRERDYIVMQDIETDHHQTAVHEYTHLVVEHAKMQLPIWLNEGLADLYSSLEPHGQQAMVGRPLPSRIGTLREQKWMDWNTLFAVGHDSPFYNEREKMSIFYAQSWALTHMLALSPAYMPKFSQFLLTMANGTSTPEALQHVYGKTVLEISKDVALYVQQASLRAALYNLTLSQADLNARVTELSDFQINLALADLLASRKETRLEARRRLLALANQNPQSSEAEESLGYLAWQEDNGPEARKHLSLAVERGSKNSRMIYDLAGLEQAGGAAPQAVIDLLQKVIAQQPNHNDARIFLAQLETERGHYESALAAIATIHTVQPEQAFRFFSVAAYSQANLQHLEEAKSLAERALQYAKTPAERGQIEQLLESLSRASHPVTLAANPDIGKETQSADHLLAPSEPLPTLLKRSQGLPRVLGRTKAFECGQGVFRLHLQVGSREMVFGMGNPQDVLVRNVKDLQWSCGPLSPREVTVVYEPTATAQLDGTISELIF
ncbi:MAG: hypothetical protein JO182_19235 [Acidobacteriaceae bacterium]|nr:hypothetical protein [Acidobacteriaceae bacterium]